MQKTSTVKKLLGQRDLKTGRDEAVYLGSSVSMNFKRQRDFHKK